MREGILLLVNRFPNLKLNVGIGGISGKNGIRGIHKNGDAKLNDGNVNLFNELNSEYTIGLFSHIYLSLKIEKETSLLTLDIG